MENDPFRVACLDPALLWSRERFEKGNAYFFQHSVGNRRYDGSRLERVDTNMCICGMLCMPQSFTREEIRIYPGDERSESVFSEFMETVRIYDRHNFDQPIVLKDLLPEHHVPLPEPDRFKRNDMFDLVEEARPMMEIVNGGHMPCVRVRVPMDIQSADAFCTELVSQADGINGLMFYVVYVGRMWGPSNWLSNEETP